MQRRGPHSSPVGTALLCSSTGASMPRFAAFLEQGSLRRFLSGFNL